MKSLVTGGAGFIGSNLVNKLLELGHEVICIDDESGKGRTTPTWHSYAKNYKLDVSKYDDIKDLFYGVDYVFHMAAEVRVQGSIDNPLETFEKNVIGTASVLQCSREAKVKRFMLSSTSSAYGKNNIPNVETQNDDPLNPYSVSKVSAEKICKMYTELFGLETFIFRYFNVYGDNQPISGPYAPVIGIFKRQKDAEESLTIVGDGSQKRDFIHVSDIVKANIMAATTKLNEEDLGKVYNVGFGKNYSVKEIADMISLDQTHIPQRDGEVKESLADISRICDKIGWQPEVDMREWIADYANR
jgi:UDP-glucose 4-epimerase